MVKAHYPESLNEALTIKAEKKDQSLLVMGGSDVMVVHKTAPDVIYLNSITGLKYVEQTEEYLRIGAGCTYAELIDDELVPEILRETMREIASPAIRK